ncbi:MAG: ComEC/Rec2 family competence protein [Patescibacteria group bacterium]
MRQVTILVCVGCLAGVAAGNVWAVSHWWEAAYFVLGILTIGLLLYRWRRYVWPGAVFLLAMILGNWRLGVALIIPDADVSHYINQTISIHGIIIDDPQTKSSDVQFTLRAATVEDDLVVSGKVLVKTDLHSDYQYGNVVTAICKLTSPGDSNQSGYARYLSRFGTYALCDYPIVTVEQEFAGNPIWRWLYQIKQYFLEMTEQVLPEPTAGLLSGLLLGIGSALPDNLMDSFNATGLTHIVALSGFNISIVAGAILGLLRWLPLSGRVSVAIVMIWLFVLLTGAAPSAIRAAIMGVLILSAGLVGRLADITTSLSLTAAGMVMANPKILAGDIGFQLSFLATVGIIYLSPVMRRYLRRWPDLLCGLACPTLAALILVTPLLALNFGRVSLIAPITNVLVVPLVPIAMLLGFWAVAGGFIQADLGAILGWIAWAPLRLMVVLAEYFRGFPGASINIEVHSTWWIWLYYLGIVIFLINYYVQQKPPPLKPVSVTNFT